jgi:polar amino acid transport system substrate-binding protein
MKPVTVASRWGSLCRLLFGSILLGSVWFSPLCAATDLLLTYTHYPPYSREENGAAVGLEIDLLNELLGKRMGYTLQHRVLPWERAQQMVKNGEADAFVATRNPERAAYADASSEALTYWDVALYFRKGDTRITHIQSLQDLAGLQIGSLNGNGWSKKNLVGMQVQYVNKMALLPKMLVLGRIDVIPDSPYVMRGLLKQEADAAKIDEILPGFLRESMHVYVGKHSPLRRQLPELDAALKQMKQDGSWQRMHERYK